MATRPLPVPNRPVTMCRLSLILAAATGIIWPLRQEDVGQTRMGRRYGMAAPGENLQDSAKTCLRNTMIRAKLCIRRAYPDVFEQTSGRR